MKRKLTLLLCLVLTAAMLAGCAGNQPTQGEVFPEMTQALGPVTQTDTPVPVSQPDTYTGDGTTDGGTSIFDANPYDVLPADDLTAEDILSEEDYIDPNEADGSISYLAQPDDTYYPYAGSTPIPLDPIDMPSPTPRAPLSFTYVDYTSANVGVLFEGPAGWQVDESQPQVMIISEPDAQIKDGQLTIITLSAEPVTSNYSQSDLRSQVNQRLDTIGSVDFDEFNQSLTASRYMMGSEGVYANYSGRMVDGIEVGGRILYVCIDRVLYGLEIIYPLGFRDDMLDVYNQIRSSMKTAT